MRIDRREFVVRSSWAAGLAFVPDWVAGAFGVSSQDPEKKRLDRAAQLRAARQRAVACGKPLLVLVVPREERQCQDRGQRFGALLNHGGRDVLLDLALCEPACATVAEVQTEFGSVEIEGEPVMLVLEPARSTEGVTASWSVTAIAPELATEPKLDEAESYETYLRADKQYQLDCNAKLAAGLRAAVAETRGALAERADRERMTLAASEHSALDQFFAAPDLPLDDDLLVRAAAVVRMAAEAPRRPGDRERLLKFLVAASRRTFVDQRIAGSKWARSLGCGTTIEGDKQGGMAIACGMGHVPEMCQRFLYLFNE